MQPGKAGGHNLTAGRCSSQSWNESESWNVRSAFQKYQSACGIVFFWNAADLRTNNLRFHARAVLERANTMESVGVKTIQTHHVLHHQWHARRTGARDSHSIALLLTTVLRQSADLFIYDSKGLVDRFNSICVIAWA